MPNERFRNQIVGLFMLIGLVVFGWLVMRFGDLPSIVSRYDARIVTVWLPETANLKTNSRVVFRGYTVGKILSVSPPAAYADPDHPDSTLYGVKLEAAVASSNKVPANVTARVVRGGLGASYLELVLDQAPSEELLISGQQLYGSISMTNQFISEDTQKKLDSLIVSMTTLSEAMQTQLKPLPPDQLDPAREVYANMTTAVMRLDEVLKHFNTILGDPDNQKNIKEAITSVRDAADGIRQTARKADLLLEDAHKMVDSADETVAEIKTSVTRLTDTYQQVGVHANVALDELSGALNESRKILAAINAGEGTLGQLATDSRLYESFIDVSQRIELTMKSIDAILQQWQQDGVRMKLK